MKLLQLKGLGLPGILFLILALLFLPGLVMAQEAVTVQLDSIAGSGVSGTATLTAAGEGTLVTLDIQGLAPGATAQGAMQANTCDMPSASFAALPELTADGSGRATASGAILFRGTDDVALATMADGAHVITIQTGQVVACGVIPALASPASDPPALPATGGVASSFMATTVMVLGLCALAAGLFLGRHHSLSR
jgi:hypothetical protein